MKRPALLIFALALLLTACSKNSPQNPAVPGPGKSALVFPAENSLCVNGSVVSDVQSIIEFSWNATANTDGYQLDIKNLLTGAVTTQLSTTPKAQVVLFRNTPYSWTVTSRSLNTTASTQSDTWKFYNAGPVATSYAPFPPSPLEGPYNGKVYPAGTTTVDIYWMCSDVDNDIVGYDIYFGPTKTPALYKADFTQRFLYAIPVSANTAYYYYIIAKDSKGNTARSDTYILRVD